MLAQDNQVRSDDRPVEIDVQCHDVTATRWYRPTRFYANHAALTEIGRVGIHDAHLRKPNLGEGGNTSNDWLTGHEVNGESGLIARGRDIAYANSRFVDVMRVVHAKRNSVAVHQRHKFRGAQSSEHGEQLSVVARGVHEDAA